MHKSLRARLALFFVSAMLGILLAAFSVIYYCEYSYVTGTIRKRLNLLLAEFNYEYLTAHEEPADGLPLDPKELPQRLLAQIRSRLDGFVPYSVYRGNRTGVLYVVGTAKKGVFELLLLPDSGDILTIADITDIDRLAHLDEEFHEESFAAGEDAILLLMTNSAGKQVTCSVFNERLLPPLLNVVNSEAMHGDFIRETQLLEQGFMVIRLQQYDGNYLYAVGNLAPWYGNRRALCLIFLFTFLGIAPLGVILAISASRKFTSGLERVSHAATEIEKGKFDQQVQKYDEGVEIDNFIDAFNRMVSTTRRTLENLRNVTDDVAHDLRTPLTRMRGLAELALYQNHDSELAGMVAEECDKMLSLINTMLDITRTEMGLTKEQQQPLDLTKLTTRLVDFYATLAEDRNIALNCNASDASIVLNCQPHKIEQLFANLIDNAMKYTPNNGHVTITLTNSDHKCVEFIVEDDGCGIAQKDIEHIFERFYRADTSRTRTGNGLGLSMAMTVAKAHGGDIRVQSTPGTGSIFTVSLPLK